MTLLSKIGDLIWNPWMLGAFLLTGLICSLRTGFFQLFGLRIWLSRTAGSLMRKRDRGSKGGISSFQALSTALASTIGTGSIVGVATAVFYGGPGAVFWMWISAFLGMMTGYVEKTLAVRYRRRTDSGFTGGPMYYIRDGMGCPALAVMFSFFCVCATLVGGNLVQANSISASLHASFGWPRLLVGIGVAALTGLVMLGGIGRIAGVSERLVPVMAALFLAGGGLVLFRCRAALPQAVRSIFVYALTPRAVAGGGGYGMLTAMRYGIARGVFTNEAGLGSSAIAHAAAEGEGAAEQGMWAILEVFVATLVVCTVTALVLLTSGVYVPELALDAIRSGRVDQNLVGAPLSTAAFTVGLGRLGPVLVSVCLTLFAFSSILGWSYYGEQSLRYLVGSDRLRGCYRCVFLAVIVVGSVSGAAGVWLLADIFNALMAAPNLLAILLMAPEASELLRKRIKKRG